jgi:superoxide dismutase, Cu-Zn family
MTRHVGDLGNLTTDSNGQVTLNMNDALLSLTNATRSIINRTVIVHRMRDDGGQGGFADSSTTG